MVIREELTRPGPITGPAEVCINATGQIFSVAANPPVMPVGGATEYLWTLPAGWNITAGLGTRQITVNIGGSAGSRTVSVVNRYTTLPNCPSNNRDISVTVSPLSVGGSITGGTTPLCLGSSTGTMTLSGNTGNVVRWEKRLGAGAWSNIANTNVTYSETPSAVGSWQYRALVQSGSCSSIYSGTRTIVVDPAATGGTLSGGIDTDLPWNSHRNDDCCRLFRNHFEMGAAEKWLRLVNNCKYKRNIQRDTCAGRLMGIQGKDHKRSMPREYIRQYGQ